MGFWKNFISMFKNEAAGEAGTESTQNDSGDALFEALIRGNEITRDMALTIPKVSSCVNRISETIARVPFRLYQITEEDGRTVSTEVTDDNRVRLINQYTNDTLTGFEFKKAIVSDFLLGKGGFAYINRSGNAITSINYIEDKYVQPMKATDPIFKEYLYQINGKQYDDYEILRLLRSSTDGCTGKSLIKEISKAIETAYSALLYELRVTQTGGVKRGFLEADHPINDEKVREKIKKAWARMYSGDQSETVILLSNGIKFKEANQTPLDLQLDKIRADMNRDIQEAFGVEDDDEKFLNHTIKPILTAFVNVLNVFLLLEKEKETMYFIADVRDLEKKTDSALLSINEARYRDGLPTIPGLDIIPLSLGTTFVDVKTGEFYTPNTGETHAAGDDGKNTSEGGEGGDE